MLVHPAVQFFARLRIKSENFRILPGVGPDGKRFDISFRKVNQLHKVSGRGR